MDAKSVMNTLLDYDAHRTDTIVDIHDMVCNITDNHIKIHIDQHIFDYGITRWGIGQLSTLLDIPARYIHKCPPELASYNLNYWIGKTKRRQVKLCLKTGGNQLIIGIVTPRYTEYQNIEFFEDIVAALSDIRYSISDISLNDICIDISISLSDYINDKDMGIGLHLRNSEVGYAAASVTTILYGNGIYIPIDTFLESSCTKMIHLKKDHDEFKESMNKIIDNISYKWKNIINLYIQSQDHAITIKEVRDLIKEFNLPHSIVDNKVGLEIFSDKADMNQRMVLKDIIDGLNEEANKLEYPRKWEIQKVGGVVLGRLTDAVLW